MFMSTTEDIWNNLMSQFKQDDAPRVYEIKQRLSSIQQGDMDVSTYYMDLILCGRNTRSILNCMFVHVENVGIMLQHFGINYSR